MTDREPQPSDGPDYHAEHAAWRTRQGRDDGTQGLTAHEKVPLLRAKIEQLERERDDLQRQMDDVRELIKPQWRRTYSEDYSQGRNDMIDAIRAVLPPEENDTT